MRTQKLWIPILLALLLGLCGCVDNTRTTSSTQDFPPPAENGTVSAVTFAHTERGDEESAATESAVITGKDADGNPVWTYETDAYELTELVQIEEIALSENAYYLNDGGTITALDRQTGAVLWRNDEFGGASSSFSFHSDGNSYFCGYYGPDFFAIDKDGNTLARIASFDDNYFWASGIMEEADSDNLVVTMAGGPDEEAPDGGYRFVVNANTFEYHLENE